MSDDNDTPEYGVPNLRTADGERKPVDHEFTFRGDDIKIQFVPPSVTELDDLQGLGEEVDDREFARRLQEHIVKPEIDPDDITERELLAYQYGIMDYNLGSGFAGALADALEGRGGDSGN